MILEVLLVLMVVINIKAMSTGNEIKIFIV